MCLPAFTTVCFGASFFNDILWALFFLLCPSAADLPYHMDADFNKCVCLALPPLHTSARATRVRAGAHFKHSSYSLTCFLMVRSRLN